MGAQGDDVGDGGFQSGGAGRGATNLGYQLCTLRCTHRLLAAGISGVGLQVAELGQA